MRANPLLPTQLFRVAKDIDSRESEKWLKRVSRESSNSPCPTSYSMEFSRSLGLIMLMILMMLMMLLMLMLTLMMLMMLMSMMMMMVMVMMVMMVMMMMIM